MPAASLEFWSKLSTFDSSNDGASPLEIPVTAFLDGVKQMHQQGFSGSTEDDASIRRGLCTMAHGREGFVATKRPLAASDRAGKRRKLNALL
ncbi:hypothetical protein JCM3766R1_002112 [Sporobolomyces carnicolor]